MEKERFEFQRYREFGDIIGDSFTFLIRNLKPLTLGFIVFVVPIFLLGSLVMIPVMKFMLNDFSDLESISPLMTSIGSLFFFVAIILGTMMMYALVYSLIEAYQEHPDEELSVELLWSYMPGAVSKILLVSLIFFLAVALSSLVFFGIPAMVSPFLVFITVLIYIPLIMYFLIKYSFTPYIYFREKTNLVEAFQRSAFIIKDNWWWTLLVLMVVSIIASLVSYIFVLPATLYLGASSFLSTEAGDVVSGPSTMALIVYGLSMIGSLFTNAYTVVGLILQYYSLRETKEGTNLMKRIEQIGSDNPNDFDNEGEF